MQIKAMKYYYTPIRMAGIQNPDRSKSWKGFRAIIGSRWEFKARKVLGKTDGYFLSKTDIFLPQGAGIIFLGIYQRH